MRFIRHFFFLPLLCAFSFNLWAQEVLPFKEVFLPKISQNSTPSGYETQIQIEIPAGYYLYAQKLSLDNKVLPDATIQFSATKEKNDPFFGLVEIYDDSYPVNIAIQHSTPQDTFTLYAQGCQDGVICYPPDKWDLSVSGGVLSAPKPAHKGFLQQQTQAHILSASNLSATDASSANNNTDLSNTQEISLAQRLSAHYWLTLPWLLLLGIGLSFTACVYPLIPIVTSLVVGKNSSAKRSYALISLYVLGMGMAMAVLGAVFGLFNQLNLQAALQKPWVIVIVAAIFVLLSLSMFDVYTLQTPRFLQQKIDYISRKQSSGSALGAIILGALSILIVSPCATPVLTALLIYTTQTTALKGALALFIFGIGTGLPLLLFAGVLRRFMPKAGMWMIFIKHLYGIMMLAIALWLITRIMPSAWAWSLWALFALALAVFFANQIPNAGKPRYILQFLHYLALLAALISAQLAWVSSQYANPPTQTSAYHAAFTTVNTLEELSQALKQSKQPSIVDFYADWCVECKLWERDIWKNRSLSQALSQYQLLKIDVTDYNDEHQKLFRELSLVAPPAVLFYPPHAKQLSAENGRIIGAMSASDFAQYLTKLQ